MLDVVRLNVHILNVRMQIVLMLSVIMMNVVMLNVMAPAESLIFASKAGAALRTKRSLKGLYHKSS
jgi:hypothetical protein